MNADGRVPGATVDNIRKIRMLFKKHYKNQGLSVRADSPKKREAEILSAEAKVNRIRKGAKDVIKVDPMIGLHSLIADIETDTQDQLVSHANNMRYIALKAKIFELIMKLEGDVDIELDVDDMKRRTDLISMFVYDIASRVDQLMKDVGDEFALKYSRSMVDGFLDELRGRLDVKQLYLDFMSKVGDEFND